MFSGEACIEAVKENTYHVILLDYMMPGMDGIEVLKKVKEINPNAKVVMITAAAQSTKIMEAIKLGAEEFIAKPYEAAQVEDALKRLI